MTGLEQTGEPGSPGSPPPELGAGAVVGRYRIVRSLGEGGMGEVFLAEDSRLRRPVALKFLPARLASDGEWLQRFEQEARLASSLNHPHIAHVYELDEWQRRPFIAMEYIDGVTLAAQQLPLTGAQIAHVGRQVADALRSAHAKGIVHRDVKPFNIMMTSEGTAKVLDFGIAKRDGGESTTSWTAQVETSPGILMGTLRYTSPEQLSGERLTGASDIFSLGIVLYELATGAHPFQGGNAFSQLHAILATDPVPPHRLNPAVPAQLETIVLRMLSKDPSLRPTATELESSLAGIALEDTPSSTRVRRVEVRPTVGRKRERVALEEAFASAAAGVSSLVSVAGEPGIGKTTLVESFVTGLRSSRAARVAWGRCSERLAGTEAYLPVLEALDSLLSGDDRVSGAHLLRQIAPTWYGQLFPAPSDESAPRTELQIKPASQERLKRELRVLLEEISRTTPLVLVLDDVHWADASTVDVLGYLTSQMASLRVLIVATYRPTDLLLAKHPFIDLKLDLATRGVGREITLDFLDRNDTVAYLNLQFPANRFPAALSELIHSKTEGNPLFMVDLVRYLADRGIIQQTDTGWALEQSVPDLERDLPESVRSMIERKIGRLTDADRQLLVTASVQGHEFDSAVLSRVLEQSAADIEERLDQLDRVHAFLRVGLEEELADRTPNLRCRFVHVLYQNALFASLRPTRRAALSASIANAVIALRGDHHPDVVSELAFLFEGARDNSRAAKYFLQAAKAALRIFAYTEAASLAQHGLRLLQSLADSPERTRQELTLQLVLGTAWVSIKGYAAPDVERVYARARELCTMLGDPPEVSESLFGLFVFYLVRGSLDRAQDLGDQMLGLATRYQSVPLRIEGLLMHGMTMSWRGQHGPARAQLEEGIATYDPALHSGLAVPYLFDPRVGCQRYLAILLWLIGFPDEAERTSELGITYARSLGHQYTLVSALWFDTQRRHFVGDPAAVLEQATTTLALAREYAMTFWEALAMASHGWALSATADPRDLEAQSSAIKEIEDGIEQHAAVGSRLVRPYSLGLLAEACLRAGRLERAHSALDDAFATIAETEERYWEPELHRVRGLVHLAETPPRQSLAESAFRCAIETARAQGAVSLESRASASLDGLTRDV
jgi:predicted ATPase